MLSALADRGLVADVVGMAVPHVFLHGDDDATGVVRVAGTDYVAHSIPKPSAHGTRRRIDRSGPWEEQFSKHVSPRTTRTGTGTAGESLQRAGTRRQRPRRAPRRTPSTILRVSPCTGLPGCSQAPEPVRLAQAHSGASRTRSSLALVMLVLVGRRTARHPLDGNPPHRLKRLDFLAALPALRSGGRVRRVFALACVRARLRQVRRPSSWVRRRAASVGVQNSPVEQRPSPRVNAVRCGHLLLSSLRK